MAQPALEKELVVSLTVFAETLSARQGGLCFRCDRNEHTVQGGISELALRDLTDFHALNSSKDKALRVLLPEIERLTNAKCDAGRFEENGWLVIRPVDLLRYGFQGRARPAA
jgi:hypothetical protein